MQQRVSKRLWAAGLTGIPFGIFKIGAGLAATVDVHPVVGLAFIVLGSVDIVMNVAWALRPTLVAACLLAQVGRVVDRWVGGNLERLGLAADTLLSFVVVSTMLWFGRIGTLPHTLVLLWEVSVIANILGVGIERVAVAMRETLRSRLLAQELGSEPAPGAVDPSPAQRAPNRFRALAAMRARSG